MKSIEIELDEVEPDLYDEETVALNRDDLMAAAQLVRHASRPSPPAPSSERAANGAAPNSATQSPYASHAHASRNGYGQLGEAASYGIESTHGNAYGEASDVHSAGEMYGTAGNHSSLSSHGDAGPGGYGAPSHPTPGGYGGVGGGAPYGSAMAATYSDASGRAQYSQSGYGNPGGYNNPGGYGDANGYGNPGGYGDANGYSNPGGYGDDNGYGRRADASGYHAAIPNPHHPGSFAPSAHGGPPAAPPAAAIQRVASNPYAPASFGPGASVASAPASQFNPASGLESATADPFRKRRWGLGSWLLVTVGFLSLASVGLVAGVAATERGRAWLKELFDDSSASPTITATAPFDPAAANRALERMEAQAGECLGQYANAVKGRLNVRFGVDGKVKHVNLEGAVASLGELACVRSAFEAAQVRPFTGQEAQVQKAVELTPPRR